MGEERRFGRVLLKLSGEALKGSQPHGIDPDSVARIAGQVKEVVDLGTQVALVTGAGNIFRGLPASHRGMTRATADQMGMMATVMNSLAMMDCLQAVGVDAYVQTAMPIPGIADGFDRRRALAHLQGGGVVIFAAGTGHPFFTTDTTAALRACEIDADVILKATKVDGVYSDDPMRCPTAVRYARLAFTDALVQGLAVMDATAFSLCMQNSIPIVVFDFSMPGALRRVACGDTRIATVVTDGETVVDTGPRRAAT